MKVVSALVAFAHFDKGVTMAVDFGHLIEGIVEQDPLTDRFVIKVEMGDGTVNQFDVQDALSRYKGQEVRLTLASFEAIAKLADMVEEGPASCTNEF